MFVRTESFSQFKRQYPVTFTLLLLHLVFWILYIIPLDITNSLFYSLIGVNALITQGEYWRLVTAMLLHSSFTHLLFNSFSLFLFGPGVEKILTRSKFLLFYIGCGVTANLATLLFEAPFYSHVGSSGAIFGLFGLYLHLIVYKSPLLTKSEQQIVIALLIIGLVSGFLNSGINNIAHIGGLISGFFFAFLFLPRNRLLMR
ncbi:rhomboid family intramembrane serine protease [Priestia megaterium]|nr:rhomboid family intramembrane serine protease [Priestia megaterium]